MSDPNRSSLESLYRNRRHRHPAPESLQKNLLSQTQAKRPGQPRWLTLAPAFASLALVLVILLPNLDSEPESRVSNTQTLAAPQSASAPPEETARLQSKVTADDASSEESMTFSSSAIMADEVNERALASESLISEATATDLQPEQAKEGIALQVLQSDIGVARTCDGMRVRSALLKGQPETQWFQIEWINDAWQRTALTQNPCPGTTSD